MQNPTALYFSVVLPPAHSVRFPTEWHAHIACTRGAFNTPLEANQWAQKHLLRGDRNYTVRPYRVNESRKAA